MRADADLAAEMQAHIELDREDRLARGESEDSAARIGRIQLGKPASAIERIRDQELITSIESWWRDVALGIRTMRSNPVFSVTAILILALGIGANGAIFTLLYGLTLRDLPTRAPNEIVRLGFAPTGNPGPMDNLGLTHSMLNFLRQHSTSFSALAGGIDMETAIGDSNGSLRTYPAALVTGDFFEVVPLRPVLGRLLDSEDDMPHNAAAVWPVLLSYNFWSERFDKDPRVLGKRIRVSGTTATVVGVTPREFDGVLPGNSTKLYLPLSFINVILGGDVLNSPTDLFGFPVLGRLRGGVTIARANAELASFRKPLIEQLIANPVVREDFRKRAYTRVDPAPHGFPTAFQVQYAKPLYLMQGLVALVLLLCCLNLGGLLIARVYRRRPEFALRSALGAPPSRLVRQYLTESLLLAVIGSALGALLSWRGAAILTYFFRTPSMGEAMAVSSGQASIWFSAALCVLTTVLFGVVPAWRASRAQPATLLQSRTRLGLQRHMAGKAFVPIQVAFSIVAMVLAFLVSQSVWKLRSEHLGFDAAHVTIQTSRIDLKQLSAEARLDLYSHIVEGLRQMPHVRSAAVTFKTPMTGPEDFAYFEAADDATRKRRVALAFNDIGPGYFQTMEIPLLAGREFTAQERNLQTCIVSQSAARLLFPAQQPLGLAVRPLNENEYPAGMQCRVIGVAADAKFSDVHHGPPPTIYFPLSVPRMGTKLGNLVFLINSETKPQAIDAFKKVLAQKAPRVPLAAFVTLAEQVDAAMGSEELTALLSTFLAIMTVSLSAIGLYGFLSSIVVQRSAGLAMRMALGARMGRILAMIIREAMSLVLAGLLLGFLFLATFRNEITALLPDISSLDPVALLWGTLIVLAAGLLAAVVPAIRAVSIDPATALRADC